MHLFHQLDVEHMLGVVHVDKHVRPVRDDIVLQHRSDGLHSPGLAAVALAVLQARVQVEGGRPDLGTGKVSRQPAHVEVSLQVAGSLLLLRGFRQPRRVTPGILLTLLMGIKIKKTLTPPHHPAKTFSKFQFTKNFPIS